MATGEDYQQLLDDYQRLKKEHQELKADYDQLNTMFENMGLGYEEALLLYDRAMESSRMKTDFIHQISHEIRTPLNILSGFTQILTTPDMELDEATKEELSKGIADNTQRITGLVNKMLELANVGNSAEIERNDNVPAVQIATQAADDSRISMAQHVTFDIQIVESADAVMLCTNLQLATRALSLLLDNAQKFTHPAEAAGGAAAMTEKARVVLRLEHHAVEPQQMRFIVEDTGIGVPPEEAEHIFEEFVQLDEYYDGTGIGLTVARSIARRLGGDIVLDTTYTAPARGKTAEGQRAGKGARFVFTLPL